MASAYRLKYFSSTNFTLVPPCRIELQTYGLRIRCSTNWAIVAWQTNYIFILQKSQEFLNWGRRKFKKFQIFSVPNLKNLKKGPSPILNFNQSANHLGSLLNAKHITINTHIIISNILPLSFSVILVMICS